jgi:hypothetical protein
MGTETKGGGARQLGHLSAHLGPSQLPNKTAIIAEAMAVFNEALPLSYRAPRAHHRCLRLT